jgi:hypothetical protein
MLYWNVSNVITSRRLLLSLCETQSAAALDRSHHTTGGIGAALHQRSPATRMRKKRPAHDHSGGFGLAATAATASRHTGFVW